MSAAARNMELKAVDRDPARSRSKAVALGAADGGLITQTDTYFHAATGRLKLRQTGQQSAQLIAYQRPDVSGQRKSSYRVAEIADGEQMRALLSEALGVVVVVSKHRHLFIYENVRIHLDTVQGLGEFIELEAVMEDGADDRVEARKLDHLVEAFAIGATDIVPVGYRELLLNASAA
jgi:adenylate cyclase, class 2